MNDIISTINTFQQALLCIFADFVGKLPKSLTILLPMTAVKKHGIPTKTKKMATKITPSYQY